MAEYFDLLSPTGEPLGITKERNAVHRDGDVMRRLRREFQVKIMQEQGWAEAEFIRAFGKSYL